MPRPRVLRRLVEAGRGLGFFIALVAGTALFGLAISLPLWLFATRATRVFTVTALAAIGALVVWRVARRIARGARGGEDSRKPPAHRAENRTE